MHCAQANADNELNYLNNELDVKNVAAAFFRPAVLKNAKLMIFFVGGRDVPDILLTRQKCAGQGIMLMARV
nr:hypothetical protein [uncultured Erwinia sp.]